jgi:F-type H+-transporting ATPase subunit b
VNPLASASAAAAAAASTSAGSGLSINIFWVIVAALNFVFFLALIWVFGFRPIANMLLQRQVRIEQGLADADQARKDRDAGAAERARAIAEARRQAQALIAAAQKSAQEMRDADIAATRDELSRLREKGHCRHRRGARARSGGPSSPGRRPCSGRGRGVVGEEMNDARQRRLVDEYLAGSSTAKGQPN